MSNDDGNDLRVFILKMLGDRSGLGITQETKRRLFRFRKRPRTFRKTFTCRELSGEFLIKFDARVVRFVDRASASQKFLHHEFPLIFRNVLQFHRDAANERRLLVRHSLE